MENTMTNELFTELIYYETDIEGALRRFSGDEALYVMLLGKFPQDPTLAALSKAVDERSWDEAFTAAHALKGLAGNLGLIPLFHATGELVMLIRSGRVDEVDASMKDIKACYNKVISVLEKA